jgi:hypothetical protein
MHWRGDSIKRPPYGRWNRSLVRLMNGLIRLCLPLQLDEEASNIAITRGIGTINLFLQFGQRFASTTVFARPIA